MLTAYQKISKLMVYAIKHIVLNICSVNFAREGVFQFNTDQNSTNAVGGFKECQCFRLRSFECGACRFCLPISETDLIFVAKIGSRRQYLFFLCMPEMAGDQLPHDFTFLPIDTISSRLQECYKGRNF